MTSACTSPATTSAGTDEGRGAADGAQPRLRPRRVAPAAKGRMPPQPGAGVPRLVDGRRNAGQGGDALERGEGGHRVTLASGPRVDPGPAPPGAHPRRGEAPGAQVPHRVGATARFREHVRERYVGEP